MVRLASDIPREAVDAAQRAFNRYENAPDELIAAALESDSWDNWRIRKAVEASEWRYRRDAFLSLRLVVEAEKGE